jgi:hypothetical protein
MFLRRRFSVAADLAESLLDLSSNLKSERVQALR